MNCKFYSGTCIKKGKYKLVQKYQCKDCKKYRQSFYSYHKHGVKIQLKVRLLNNEGLGIRAIGRVLQIPRTSVQYLVAKIAATIKAPVWNEHQQEYEVDELHTYICKNHFSCYTYITYAINKATRRIIDYVIGPRNKENIGKLVNKLLELSPKTIYTDKLSTFASLIPAPKTEIAGDIPAEILENVKNMLQQPNNKYEILTLPLDYTKSFLDYNLKEIQKYYDWFFQIKNVRLTHLCNFLFHNPESCLNEKNLGVIETFLLNSVSALPKPPQQFKAESEQVPAHLKRYAKPDEYVLDNKTISICYDIGIFLGDLIIKLDNNIKWKLETDDQFRDYGQPILSKKGCSLKINPFTVAKTAASKIYEGTYSDGQLDNFFNAWKKGFKVGN